MTPTLGANSVWDILELGGGLEPLENVLGFNSEFLDGSLLPVQDLELLSGEDAAAWLVGDMAAGDEAKLVVGDPCEPGKVSVSSPAVLPAAQLEGKPEVPAVRDGLAAIASSGEWDELTGAASPHSASSGASGQGPVLATSVSGLLDTTYSSLQQQQQQHEQLRQQQGQQQSAILQLQAANSGASGQALSNPSAFWDPTYGLVLQQQGLEQQQQKEAEQQEQRQPRRGAAPRQSRGRGRPRVDRSQMTQRQLKAIENAQAHLARKKNHMRDLEERVADARADLERERAQQEDGQRAIEVLERLLSYRDDMIAVLREHGEETGAGSASRAGTSALTCSGSGNSIVSRNSGSYSRPVAPSNLYRLTMPSTPPGNSSWVYKHPSTWDFVEHVRTVELPAMQAQWKAWQACTQSTFEQHMGGQRKPGQQPQQAYPRYRFLGGPDPLRALCAKADPAVLVEIQNMDPRDIVEGWRDYARLSREVLAEYDVTRNEAKAVAQVNPHMERLAVLINLATVHNPALLKQVYLASADNFSAEQRKEKYDALVSEMEITPAQQEHYLELAEAYESFVRQARQYKAEALARIGQSAGFGSLAASGSSLGRMVSGYLEALEGAATLSAYVDAEFLAVVELTKGLAKIHNPLQKARGAAMAYPQFMDVINIMEAIKRLPPPEQRRRQLGEA